MNFIDALQELNKFEKRKLAFIQPYIYRQECDYMGFRIDDGKLVEFDMDEKDYTGLTEIRGEWIMANDWRVEWMEW